jgi:hypothetical protein
MIAVLLLAAIFTARFLPESAFGAWLNRVAMPPVVGRLSRIERKHVIFAVAMTLILLFAGEALAMAGPLDMGLVFVWDVSAYLDIAIATLTIAATARGRGWRSFRPGLVAPAALLRRRPVARARRVHRPTAGKPANDDEAHAWLAPGFVAEA